MPRPSGRMDTILGRGSDPENRLSGMNRDDYDPWADTDDEPGEFDSDSCHCNDPGDEPA